MRKFIAQQNPMLVNLIGGCIIYYVAGVVISSAIILRFAPHNLFSYIAGFTLGVIFSVFQVVHMFIGIQGMLEEGEEKHALMRSLKRYAIRILLLIVIYLLVLYFLGLESVLMTVIGMMGLKVAAYIQPFTDKLVSKILK